MVVARWALLIPATVKILVITSTAITVGLLAIVSLTILPANFRVRCTVIRIITPRRDWRLRRFFAIRMVRPIGIVTVDATRTTASRRNLASEFELWIRINPKLT